MADSQHTPAPISKSLVAHYRAAGLSRREAQKAARKARQAYEPAWIHDPRCPRCASWDECRCLDGVPKTTRELWARIMPLHYFPDDHRAWIDEQVSWDIPPERWRGVGPSEARKPIAYIENRAWHEWHWTRGIYPDSRREPIPRYVREEVMRRDGLVCQICATEVEPNDVHLDHIKPYSRGGRHTIDNLRVTHSACNIRRGAPADYHLEVR